MLAGDLLYISPRYELLMLLLLLCTRMDTSSILLKAKLNTTHITQSRQRQGQKCPRRSSTSAWTLVAP